MGGNRQTAAPVSLREIGKFAAILAIFFVVLNIAFNIHSQHWEFAWGFPVELLSGFGLVAMSVVLQRWQDKLRILATAIIVFAVGFHLIDTVGRAIHGRRLDLVFDSAQFPHIIDLLAASLPVWLVWSGVVLTIFVLVAVFFGTALAIDRLYRQFALGLTQFNTPRNAAVLVIAIACLGLLDSNGLLADRPVATTFQGTEAARYHAETVYLWVDGGKSALASVTGDRNGIRDGETTLPGLVDTDVILIFIESYAASLYERETHLATMTGLYDRYGASFAEKGIHAASALMDSPTYGGLSWLAHLTLTSGARLDRNLTYRAYLNSDLDTLQSILHRTGHQTILVKPGIKRFWPEGARLRFDRLDTAEDIPYSGPDFGYFAIPDQVSLAHLATVLETRSVEPVLAQIALISSHYPFRPLPPFIGDTARLDDPEAWDAAIVAQKAGKDWQDPVEGYRRAIAYTLESVLDFVDRTTDDNDLIIVLGDHQPWRVVSGNLGGRATPMHVFSRNQTLVDAFLSDGYTSGLMPDTTAAPIPMEAFLPRLVRYFGDNGS
ncbi:MAG: sulfatase-like hydrolase/transferase [Alphaproteobacteria bacterium]